MTPSRWTKSQDRAFTLAELLAVIAVMAIVFALMLPLSRSAGPAARRSQCVNNLKQIALGLRNYESAYGALPPAYTVDAEGKPLHSWRTLILPYVEEGRLYETIDLSKPWNDPANAGACAKAPSLYWCPELKSSANSTTYLAVVGPNSCFLREEPRRLCEVTDDEGITLMVIEGTPDQAVHWMAPIDTTEPAILAIRPESRLNHTGGMNAACVDGSVKFLRARDPAAQRHAMITISANDDKVAKFME